MNDFGGSSLVFGTLHALGFATGAALCAMLGVLQWRSARLAGGSRGVILLWVCGVLWTAGNFLRLVLRAAGIPEDGQILNAVFAIAWTSTVLGMPSMTLAMAPVDKPRVRRLVLGSSILSSGVVFVLYMLAGFWPDFPLPVMRVSVIAFLNVALHLPMWMVLLWMRPAGRERAKQSGRPWVFWASAALFGALFLSTGVGIVVKHGILNQLAGLIGAQWAIPSAVLAATALAKTDYADVILKRSLALILSVALSAAVAWTIPGLPLGLPLVLAALAGAALILASPLLHRSLSWLVERVLLRKPDYRVSARDFAAEARRIGDPGELEALAEQRIETALGLKASLKGEGDDAECFPIKGGKMLALSPARRARALMGAEHAFLDAIGDEVARREETLAFEAERRDREIRETVLKQAATEAELKALRAQVDPHFLFNTLNTIADLIAVAPDKAETMTERLSAFFRYTLTRHEKMVSTLDEELDFVRLYLAIEEARFGDRLTVAIDKDKGLGDEIVPSLILQPLVENAVKHGLASKREGGRIEVRAARSPEGGLLIEVRDDGVGFKETGRQGVGLANVRNRLKALWGEGAAMTVGKGPGGKGTSIVLSLPSTQAAHA